MDKRALSLMSNIMSAITGADEWENLQMHDPGVEAAADRWEQARERARAYLPKDIYNELSNAQCGEVAAYSDIAILYGMRVAAAIQETTANPMELTRFRLERLDKTVGNLE